MGASILAVVAVVFILGTLCTAIAACVAMLHGGNAKVRRWQAKRPRGSRITADEIIDVHLALKDVASLREIAERVAA